MGNNSSTQAVSPSHPQDASTIASTEAETSSGVFLTNELQEKVLLDFNSQVLKERWEHHQKHILEKVSDRQQKAHERKEKLAQEINQWSIKNDKLQFELDSKIDEQMSQLTDLVHAVDYDLQRIENKCFPKQSSETITSSRNKHPCLAQQVDLATCHKSNPKEKSIVCDVYVNALDSCIKSVFDKKQ